MTVSCRQHLDAIIASLPELPAVPEGQRGMIHVLMELGEAWPGPLNEEQTQYLHELCRKVAVSKTIREYYSEDWKPIEQSEELSLDAKALFVAILQYWAAGEIDRGLSLKCINAALHAMEKFSPSGIPFVETLASVNEQHLAHLMPENANDAD